MVAASLDSSFCLTGVPQPRDRTVMAGGQAGLCSNSRLRAASQSAPKAGVWRCRGGGGSLRAVVFLLSLHRQNARTSRSKVGRLHRPHGAKTKQPAGLSSFLGRLLSCLFQLLEARAFLSLPPLPPSSCVSGLLTFLPLSPVSDHTGYSEKVRP